MRGDPARFRPAIVATLVTIAPVALAYGAGGVLDWFGCTVSLGLGISPCGLSPDHARTLASIAIMVIILSPFLLVPALIALVFWIRFAVSWWLDPGEGVI